MTKKDHEYGISNLKQNLFSFNNINAYNYINRENNHLMKFHHKKEMEKITTKNKYSMDDLLDELLIVNNHTIFANIPPGPVTEVFTTFDPATITTQG